MSKEIPTYLRLHKEEANSAAAPPTVELDEVQALLKAFSDATGWSAKPISPPPSAARGRARTTNKKNETANKGPIAWEVVSSLPMDGVLDESDLASLPAVSQQAAQKLMDSIARLVDRLDRTEKAVWRQEAELATGVGISWKPEDQEHLADKLETILGHAAHSIGCDAGAMYLLDDATSVLKMRSCTGLSKSRLTLPPRELRGSLADLEALLGNAVLMEDIEQMPQWQSPEAFGSAICVPLGSVAMPQGTLWFWSEQPRAFTSHEIEIARMAARELMAELERCVLGSEVAQARVAARQLDVASVQQSSRLPNNQVLDRRYDIAGWTQQVESVGGNFHMWDLLPAGNIAVALGAAKPIGLEGCIIATTLQTTLENLWPLKQTPAQMVRRANDVLWNKDDGNWCSSLSYLQLDPDNGHGSLVNAGANLSWIVSQQGFRPIGGTGPMLSMQPDPVFTSQRFTLHPGECLVLVSPKLVGEKKTKSLTQDHFLGAIRELLGKSANTISQQINRQLGSFENTSTIDRSLVLIKRKLKS